MDLRTLTASSLIALLPLNASAFSVFYYDEAASGDLSDAPPYQEFTFDIDSHDDTGTVSTVTGSAFTGTLCFNPSCTDSNFESRHDAFILHMGTDTWLEDMWVVNTYDAHDNDVTPMDALIVINELNTSRVLFDGAWSGNTSPVMFGPGDYLFTYTFSGPAVIPSPGNPDGNVYELSMSAFYQETVVPLPAAAWLFLSGILSMGAMLAKRHRTGGS